MEKDYNTGRRGLRLPEYGRNVQKMVASLMEIEDREKRNEQAKAVVKVMELLNPQVHLQEDYERKLWDHLIIISDFKLDVDSPYPKPTVEEFEAKPAPIPIEKKPIKASHYGRNIESIIDLIETIEDEETRTYVIRNLAIYMRTQYLIWNKDSVADETIFADIEKLSDGRIKVPEGLTLSKVDNGQKFDRPGQGQKPFKKNNNRNKNRKK